MQFDNQTTRNVADVVAKILAGESAKQEPQMLDEELVGNQHKIDANKNNKIDAHDFKLLRKKKKVEEETELAESHFKVGDKVKCKESGMDGEITKIDKEDGGEDEKYYTFKREDGKVMKKAPNELTKINEEVHNKKKDLPFTPDAAKKPVRNSDGTIQKPMSLARELAKRGLKKVMSKEETEIDEAMFPGTKEYEKKFGQSPQQKLKKKGDTVPTSQGDMTKTDKGVAHRRRFTEMIDSYAEGGLKYIATLVQEEPDNEEFTKEVEEQKKRDKGEIRNDKGVAKPFQAASVREDPVNPVREDTEIQVINADIANGVQFDNIEERSLSEPEMKKKEEIVMSMKKKMPGFKERYGDRAKEVMYATATKMAKKD